MSLEFLAVDRTGHPDVAAPVAQSPFARRQQAAGARFEVRDGWRIAIAFGDVEAELEACRSRVGIADRSSLGKLELQASAAELAAVVAELGAGAELAPGKAVRAGEAWWCPWRPERVLVLTPPTETAAVRDALEAAAGDRFASVVDLTAGLAALAVIGPGARELLARLTAIDLREARLPEGGFRPGSVARVPGALLREQGDRFLVLVGAYHADYIWAAITDAGEPLGAMAVGAGALERLGARGSPAAGVLADA